MVAYAACGYLAVGALMVSPASSSQLSKNASENQFRGGHQ
jgi:hypothetical protein